MRTIAVFIFAVFSITHSSPAADPLVVAKIGEQAPGFDEGILFEEVSAPAVTQDGQRVAFMAKLTGNRKTWWFGDLQPDGYYDLKLAAGSGMQVNGSAQVLDLAWLPLPNSSFQETPRTISDIHLDPVTGKLAFLGYLGDGSATDDRSIFIADDNGITHVMQEGFYAEYGYTLEDLFIPLSVNFVEIKYINDTLAFSSLGVNLFYSSFQLSLFAYADNKVEAVFLGQEDFATYLVPKFPEVTVRTVGPIALSADGLIAFIVNGSIPYPGINNNEEISLVMQSTPGSSLELVAAKWDPVTGFPFPAKFANFSELSINRNNDILVTAQCFEVDEAGLPVGFEVFENTGVFVLDPSGAAPVQALRQTFSSVNLGELGTQNVIALKNAQTAGNYALYTATFDGQQNAFQGNIGLFRHNYSDGTEELIFHAGGPSHINGLGPVYGIDHAYMGPFGDIVAQITTDNGFRRTLVHVTPPDYNDIVDYFMLADSLTFSRFDCEFSCEGFHPFLPQLGLPSPLDSTPEAFGIEGGDTPWINAGQAGWVLNSGLFGLDRFEYSVLLDLVNPTFVDYGDAPHRALNPEPIQVPTGYAEASHVINQEMFLGKHVDTGLREKDANLRYRYFGLGDDIPENRKGEDDEDGVVFTSGVMQSFDVVTGGGGIKVEYPSFIIGETISVSVEATRPEFQNAYISAWIDFDRNGDFDAEDEQVIFASPVDPPSKATGKPYTFEISLKDLPALDIGYTFARFRISGDQSILPEGREDDGEVEDYLIQFAVAMDYGDAPQDGVGRQYPTRLILNGARHTSLINTPILGTTVDYELDALPSLSADGDDATGSDDEDGIVFPSVLLPGMTFDLLATASMAGKLDGWIDFNQDGDWSDDGEQILDSVDVIEGENSLSVSIPGDAMMGTTYARFRISTAGGLLPTGLAQGGEVEDYRIELKFPPIGWEFLNPGQGQVRLYWEGSLFIEGAPTPFGPWTTLESATGEYLHTLQESSQFFRLVP